MTVFFELLGATLNYIKKGTSVWNSRFWFCFRHRFTIIISFYWLNILKQDIIFVSLISDKINRTIVSSNDCSSYVIFNFGIQFCIYAFYLRFVAKISQRCDWKRTYGSWKVNKNYMYNVFIINFGKFEMGKWTVQYTWKI